MKTNDANKEKELWDYVSGKMSSEEAQQSEAAHAQDPFWQDAVEGLQSFEEKNRLPGIAAGLKNQLLRDTKRRRPARAKIGDQQMLIVVTLLILALVIIAYLFFHFTKA